MGGGREIAGLVENIVIGKEDFLIGIKDFPVLNGYRGVVKGISGFLVLQNGPHYCHNALGFLGYLVQGPLGLFIKGKTV